MTITRYDPLFFCKLASQRYTFCKSLGNILSACYSSNASDSEDVRRNRMNIQLLFSKLHKQIFKDSSSTGPESANYIDQAKVKICMEALKKHGLWGKESSPLSMVDLKIPDLFGNNLDEHFREIADKQSSKYKSLGNDLAKSKIPKAPTSWAFKTGWTKYNIDGTWKAVDYPDEDALIFDVEVLVPESPLPILATAVSTTTWYSWCSARLVEERCTVSQKFGLNDLIPLETKHGQVKSLKNMREKLIVGHNVGYDRARIKEQYLIQGTKTRFVDTMSFHIITSGLTGLQRALLMGEMTGSKRKDVEEAKAKTRGPPIKNWMKVGSLNNLADVHKLHCGKKVLNKEDVQMFVKGQLIDVRNNFQKLMTYCANDVTATFEVFQVLWPLFFKRCPHPVTFAGMLEMSVAYLPVNNNWVKYLDNSQSSFDDLQSELKLMLMRLANDACDQLYRKRYRDDVWLWDLDWSVKNMRTKKINEKKVMKISPESLTESTKISQTIDESVAPSSTIKDTLKTVENLYVRRPNLAGYPVWYSDLCPKYSEDEDWIPGPTLISPQMQVVPKLLRLTWDGYPLHHSKINGWGYLVPGKPIEASSDEESLTFPYQFLTHKNGKANNQSLDNNSNNISENTQTNAVNLDKLWEKILDGSADASEESMMWTIISEEKESKKIKKVNSRAGSDSGSPHHSGNGPYLDENIAGCWFYRLPHKDGPNNKVGNPLAKDFISKIEDGTLSSIAGENANAALKLSKMISYWKNAHKRITSQVVVWLKKSELSKVISENAKFEDDQYYGAILPSIVTAGTVTRRAVEATWMTASNAYVDRVGSELKSMIQAFPGYRFVGADVDSQELWIAAILGDAHSAGLHGCTAFGWMTLQGEKSQGTDMHSLTAKTVGITREQAKIMNYGRIYGAGEAFASRLLMQFNHLLTPEEARSRAQKMYSTTKGTKGYILNEEGKKLYNALVKKSNAKTEDSIILPKKDVIFLLRESQGFLTLSDITNGQVWMNGTESAMFNKLEAIANSPEPRTPVLGCRISRALEPSYVLDNFITSRVNWVVQSSAVDYLHLMLVSMRWLFDQYDINGRFSISIHDEVRYLVKDEDCYRAALALQITNLLTRAMFSFKLGMNDLPESVAFFSSVDVDSVLRKEVNLECITPSNHLGLQAGYGILPGESLDIYTILEFTKGSLKKSVKSDSNKMVSAN